MIYRFLDAKRTIYQIFKRDKTTVVIVVINLLNIFGCLISPSRLIVETTINGPSRTNSTSAQNPTKKEESSNHLIECTGPGVDGNGCVIWTNIWVQTLIS